MPALIVFGGSADSPQESALRGHEVHVDSTAEEVADALSQATGGFATFKAVGNEEHRICVHRDLVRFIRDTD